MRVLLVHADLLRQRIVRDLPPDVRFWSTRARLLARLAVDFQRL